MTEAEIVAVLVHEGDVIREDAPLLEVETDKAQVEIPSPLGGRVEKIHVEPGQTVKVGAPLVTFGDGAVEPAATATWGEPKPRRRTAASFSTRRNVLLASDCAPPAPSTPTAAASTTAASSPS